MRPAPVVHHDGAVTLNPPTQYAAADNLRARQRLWEHQQPQFDLMGWVLGLAGLEAGFDGRVLDVGCGNGLYLRALDHLSIEAIGCDLSLGMLSEISGDHRRVNADVTRLPFPDDSFDVVLAPHMLYHVDDRTSAVRELRRVLAPSGVCVLVTNGSGHLRALRTMVESAARAATPQWEMRNPSTHVFSLDNGERQLRTGFESVRCIRPDQVVSVRLVDASLAADYVASVADHYQDQVDRPWSEVVDAVRSDAQREIDVTGEFVVSGDTGAFVCR